MSLFQPPSGYLASNARKLSSSLMWKMFLASESQGSLTLADCLVVRSMVLDQEQKLKQVNLAIDRLKGDQVMKEERIMIGGVEWVVEENSFKHQEDGLREMSLLEYLNWYQLAYPDLTEVVGQLIPKLYQEQNGSCRITVEKFKLIPGDPFSPYLVWNQEKKWLPEFELICWAFRTDQIKSNLNFYTTTIVKMGVDFAHQDHSDDEEHW